MAVNHLFMTVKMWCADSASWLTSGGVIMILLSSANRTGVETEIILRGRCLVYKRKRNRPSIYRALRNSMMNFCPVRINISK